MHIRKLAAVAAVAVLAAGLAACSTKAGATGGSGGGPVLTGLLAKAQHHKLVIGVKADQPGLGLQTGTRYEGFDIEIAKIIAANLGVVPSDIEWKTTVSANREAFLQQGTVDLV